MLNKFHKNSKGFTLIELMIVVVIIGILAALAIPRFMRATTKSKQSEVKSVLKQIHVLERAYFQEHDVYSTVKANIGFEDPPGARYAYALMDATTLGFCAGGSGNIDDDAAVDSWYICADSAMPWVVTDDVSS